AIRAEKRAIKEAEKAERNALREAQRLEEELAFEAELESQRQARLLEELDNKVDLETGEILDVEPAIEEHALPLSIKA
ncbi:hypothetical protein ACYT6K_10945, partial [Streptococcus pyogenes]